MKLNNIPAGKNVPEDIYVIIEIPANTYPIKYEVDKKTGAIFVDRFISTTMFYPCNYGYINNTLSLDGDPMDVMVITPHPLHPGSIIRSSPVGILKMRDEAGEDAKIVTIPHSTITKKYDYIKDIHDIHTLLRAQIVHFFQHYKDLEKNKWVTIKGWENKNAAKKEIFYSFERSINRLYILSK